MELTLMVLIATCCTIGGAFIGIMSVWVAIQFVSKFNKETPQVTAPSPVTKTVPNNDQSVHYLTAAHEEKVLDNARMEQQKDQFSDGLD